jgi:hypothetical protein
MPSSNIEVARDGEEMVSTSIRKKKCDIEIYSLGSSDISIDIPRLYSST